MSTNIDNRFDIVVCGLGLSGLSISTELALREYFDHQVLLIEPNSSFINDKIWCCWNTMQHLMSDQASHQWSSWKVKLGNKEITHHSEKYCYEQINSDLFYHFCLRNIQKNNKFTLKIGSSVSDVREENENTAYVKVGETEYKTSKVFDSRPTPIEANQLLQHFKGWHIASKRAVFDPTTVTLMDFKTYQNGVNFFYILPYSTTEALVENTYFSCDLLPNQTYDEQLEQYINKDLGCTKWEVLREEYGVIPMHQHKNSIPLNRAVINVGVTAGFAKPSTGYCYLNTQRFAQHISSLITKNIPLKQFKFRNRFGGMLDAIFTSYIVHQSKDVPRTIFDLFRLNPADRVVRFLSDMPTKGDYFGIIRSMPKPQMLLETYRNKITYGQQSTT